MQNRIKELRRNRHLTQEQLGNTVSVTQQNISRYENDIYEIPIDVLVKISNYFNVTIEYLLGLTDTKRDFEGQVIVKRMLDEYYDFIEIYKTLEEEDRELVWAIVEKIHQIRSRKD